MPKKRIRIAIVGAGAAGCFCAAQLHEALPGADIRIVEAGPEPMAKLAVTGGGRCNISNSFEDVRSLEEVYPRGASLMKRALAEYSPDDVLEWFRSRGVPFIKENGGRLFPASQNAGEIVQTLRGALDGVVITCNQKIESLPDADAVVVCTGGVAGMEILKGLPLETVSPVPSLFTFNISDSAAGGKSGICKLMGLSMNAALSIPGSKFHSQGELLITDWGFSGPATLRLSSYAARHLSELNYNSVLNVRWTTLSEGGIHSFIDSCRNSNPGKLVKSIHPEGIPARLWEYLAARGGIAAERSWAELGQKGINKLVQTLICDTYFIHGKNRFRDEFVTCGGVSLSSIDIKTLECKQRKGLYFAGEILDVDGVTGGFNLQAAWSTAHLVAKSIINKYGTQNI
ncbi:MAG: aminoacetone oxidase family FAD-binding enzyme [Bacteroidales bacterium]|nr:aminoacetone oxidase family FAD-binding enzyme [Bacteroidales bacterium]